MSLTRKHFIALSTIVKEHERNPHRRRELAERLADWCKGQNILFDRERFLTACGVKKDEL